MLILASSSPRRKELLKKLTSDFIVMTPDVDEKSIEGIFPFSRLTYEEARLKAYAIASKYPNEEVLACDTLVSLNGLVLGKPLTKKKAIEMLRLENGRKQKVLSSYTYIGKGKEISRTVSTYVYFNKLSEEEILSYVEKFKPFDKAGAYGIQDEANLIKYIEGSYDNVMGLPTEDLSIHVFNKVFR